MPTGKMHRDEVKTEVALVRRLLAAQFPEWADLPIKPVPSAGTDNALFRLGADMVVRLPRIHSATEQVHKEQRWLPRLVAQLPLAIPEPLALGIPGDGYPWHWSIYRWLDGKNAILERFADPDQAALKLAAFITTLRQIDPSSGPHPGQHNSFRGLPLIARDQQTRAAIAKLEGRYDPGMLTAAWEAALGAPIWENPPAWIHGDLLPGNLLLRRGQLKAVIDFGCLGVGDPACDLMAAWTLFSANTRATFRAALADDEAAWARGRGWALYFGVLALPYYQDTNPVLAGIARKTIHEVLVEHQQAG